MNYMLQFQKFLSYLIQLIDPLSGEPQQRLTCLLTLCEQHSWHCPSEHTDNNQGQFSVTKCTVLFASINRTSKYHQSKRKSQTNYSIKEQNSSFLLIIYIYISYS